MIIGFIKALSPIAPHVCEEIYQHYTGEDTLAYAPWPTYDPAKLVQDTVTIVVQVNGKVRGRFEIAKDSDQKDVEKAAFEVDSVKQHTEGKTIRKVIVIPNKIVNIVAA